MLRKKTIKKQTGNLATGVFTGGASIILGLLSFSGMYVLVPLLPLALAGFALSVGYEWEIYVQNIRGTFRKFLQTDYIQRKIARKLLLEHFPKDLNDQNCPQFFKDYQQQLRALKHHVHSIEDKKRNKLIEERLTRMEAWFAKQLFSYSDKGIESEKTYSNSVQAWIKEELKKNSSKTPEHIKKAHRWQWLFRFAQVFSAITGLFMAMGTTYLLTEAFTIIPFFAALSAAAWPAIIIPLALIAGAAYGLLTYNAFTDFIVNDTYTKLRDKVIAPFKEGGFNLRACLVSLTSVCLISLAVVLTICTAGTWWTVAQNSKPLLKWIARMPGFVMGILNPIFTGLAGLIFNIQNTHATSESNPWQDIKSTIAEFKDSLHKLWQQENFLQKINPFRILLKLTFTPLRILLFLGHLVSIAATGDRVPKIPEIVSGILGFIIEGFEDFHYFFGHSHAHDKKSDPKDKDANLRKERLSENDGHNHDDDFPTRVLKLVFSPIHALAALWDFAASQKNKAPKPALTWSDAWQKQHGTLPCSHDHDHTHNHTHDDEHANQQIHGLCQWEQIDLITRIERHIQYLKGASFSRLSAQQKYSKLTTLKEEIHNTNTSDNWRRMLKDAANDKDYNKHRFFNNGDTSTSLFLKELSNAYQTVGPTQH